MNMILSHFIIAIDSNVSIRIKDGFLFERKNEYIPFPQFLDKWTNALINEMQASLQWNEFGNFSRLFVYRFFHIYQQWCRLNYDRDDILTSENTTVIFENGTSSWL